ncbi:helix-turn-helix transcriptional regulator [Magnetovibrio sp. PR-2]|uniref:helix-turn-helix domain-containing protein n=1 Tax=Magnetovibrio sp. PR-2 TaxID=3120356 RepID=UPI002FCE1A9F
MAPNKVEKLRKARAWTRKVLADKVGISHSMMTKIERGERRLHEDQVRDFAKIFGVSAGEVVEGVEELQRVPIIYVSELPAIAYGAERPDHAETLPIKSENKDLIAIRYDADFGVEVSVGKTKVPEAAVVVANPKTREGEGLFFATRGTSIAIVTDKDLTRKTKPLAKITHFITEL